MRKMGWLFENVWVKFIKYNEYDDDDGDYLEMGRNRIHVWDYWRFDSSLCGSVFGYPPCLD